MAGLLIGGELNDPVSVAVGGVSGAALVFLGFGAAWRARSLHRSASVDRWRLALLSYAILAHAAGNAAHLALQGVLF